MPILPAPPRPTHDLPGAAFTTLASPSRGACETSVWRVELEPDAAPVPHRVTREEIFVALEGAAVATLDGVEHRVQPGDALVVPPGVAFSLAADGVAFSALVCLPVGGQAALLDGAAFTPPWAE